MLSSPIQSNGKAGVCSVSTVLSPREVDSQAGFCPIWSVPLQSLGTVVASGRVESVDARLFRVPLASLDIEALEVRRFRQASPLPGQFRGS